MNKFVEKRNELLAKKTIKGLESQAEKKRFRSRSP